MTHTVEPELVVEADGVDHQRVALKPPDGVAVPRGVELRRVLPPLINDFASLQKDTALVASIGVFEAFRAAQVETARDFNYTPMVVAAIGFILLTVPIARLTDWLALRAVRREQGAGA